uniref:DNA-directed RNA polymerase RBP11-like dimerisation domain-containing protein n=1 Tax=Elphidium margaritaceum TaxID=933848 RepID=A0A7S0XRG0_9EUKA|eukprot:CAMPEP_0202712562 /NCGR_PEP_ID=MMETSP1385-20130828/42957_1 /ASSEMBLY_ACC=CAM_ASM_000861 /TAXON_ID=933848 /ORGANISM="Elphidium margaritaceum" /LENGTH=123 /DNA_ID=CAMNT_0049372637 /DNA_START=23 /DNA_END=394 /DNA_ORIENTATION=+
MNQPERYECYVLEPDETKVKFTKDTKHEHSATFTILKEDHTLGNALRMQLLQDNRVLFAGYKVPHPLLYELVIKVRTNGEAPPTQCLMDSIDVLSANIKDTSDKFKLQLQKHKNSNSNKHWQR